MKRLLKLFKSAWDQFKAEGEFGKVFHQQLVIKKYRNTTHTLNIWLSGDRCKLLFLKLTLTEKLLIKFKKKQLYKPDVISLFKMGLPNYDTIIYKVINGKILILQYYLSPPEHVNCRCTGIYLGGSK